MLRALNAQLPAAIRVLAAEEVVPPFHARFAARAKTYRYRLFNGEVLDPFERAYVWHVPGPLDVDRDGARGTATRGPPRLRGVSGRGRRRGQH